MTAGGEPSPRPDDVQRGAVIADCLAGLSRLAEGEQLALVRQLLEMLTTTAREVIVAGSGRVRQPGDRALEAD